MIFLGSFIGVFVVAVPNAPPANVIGKNVTSTSIFVQWDEVPANNQNGAIVNYSPTAEVVIAQKKNATLTGLKKFTNYRITVFASTAKGGYNRSDPIIVITDDASCSDSTLARDLIIFQLPQLSITKGLLVIWILLTLFFCDARF